MIDVVTVQGVGEHVGQEPMRMAQHVMAHLDPDHYREVPVTDYVTVGPVGINPGPSLEQSVNRVVASTLDTIDHTPNPAILVGYSGGALVAGNTAAQIAAGQHPHLDVRAAILIADPAQPRGISPAGYGVYADRPTNMPTCWLWDERDPICCAGDPSPLHTLSDQLTAMTLGAPDIWAQDLIDRLRTGRWQPTAWNWRDLIGTFRRYQRALDQMRYYLNGGHFTAYRDRGAEAATWLHHTLGH